MATLKGGILGDLRGKINNLVARRVNGKTVISNRPSTYNKTKSKKAKEVRKRFSIAVEFSRHVNSIELLKRIWNYNFPKCSSAFNMIESFNIKKVGDNAPSQYNIITPPPDKNKYNIPSFVNKIHFDGSEIKIELKSREQLGLHFAEYDCYIVLIIMYLDPKEKKNKYFIMDNVLLQLPVLDGQEVHVVKSGISETLLYKNTIIYSASLAFETKGTKCYSSYTSAEYYNLNK